MSDPIIQIENLTKTFGQDTVLKGITRDFERGKIHGIVGNNGSGKTVMFKCICGFLQSTDGHVLVNGKQIGDDLTDNADDPDGYRFHDVFHLGYVAVLGWSPVIRKLLKKKRKSVPQVDEVQDGGRAQVLDEGVAALVFDYAKEHRWLEGVSDLDYKLLRTIKGVTSLLEVRERSLGEWQRAILVGFEVWRQVLSAGGGKLLVDQDAKSLTFLGPPDSARRKAPRKS